MNPILEQLNKTQTQTAPKSNNPIQMLQDFRQFKQSLAGRDPKQMVMELLNSGKMSQQQFEQLKSEAMTLQNFLR